MTVQVRWTMVCDIADCEQMLTSPGGDIIEFRQYCQSKGWKVGKRVMLSPAQGLTEAIWQGFDFCPLCALNRAGVLEDRSM
jgi:hypothetical protein